MKIGIITPEKPERAETRNAGIAGESMAAYWMNQEIVDGLETKLFDPLDSFEEIKDYSADWYLFQQSIPYCHTSVMPGNCAKELSKLPTVFWSYCSTPAQLETLGKQYKYVFHNNYHFFSRGASLHDGYIYAPLSVPLVVPNKNKNGKYIYVANYYSKTDEQKKQFLEPIRDMLDIYGSEHWENDPLYKDNYKGKLPLDSFLDTYNQYSYSMCIHNDNNRKYGEFSLGYFLALSCEMSFYLDTECSELVPVGDYCRNTLPSNCKQNEEAKIQGRQWLEQHTYKHILKELMERLK